MTIEYLKKLKENLKIGSEKSRGVSINEIEKVEKKFGIIFPTAYKEFLYLAGEYSGNLMILDTDDLETISSDWHQEIMWEELQDTGTKIDRPFWLFAESNGCEIFYFFYLDEEKSDPVVHMVNYAQEDRKRNVRSLEISFSEFISEMIDLAYRYEKNGY
ncbi:SMI1/KNR4 family protein [uncultured Flavobacterium sp.]|jgi:hypothetical protein|uniref:SMI1/KNR4 family protein n=1 Tax=uncultured Flavobacterium sp. TaxID=165435 RepID=UPI0012119E73|nr:SMI1/KNR4 family protein [uncultured Flavobacterium sp.]THD32870.1 MAG: SMI1/KNR4 family protein [Flavobacterium johnsoniae]